jgi:medium-chain acyl-[acyl-carrier-protein] hydrolase
MDLQQLEKEYRIHVYETGPDGNVNLYSLFNFMQDIAAEHAVKLGFGRDDLMKKNHFWVLSRMYAVISGWPVWEESINVKTWPNGTDKLFAIRNYEIRFPDGRLIGSASSSWLIIDRTTKKIQRPDDLLTKYSSYNHPVISSARNAVKLAEATGNEQLSSNFKVKISDLDINLHTNNVNYLKWIGDSYVLNFIMAHLPCSVEINYLAESMFGDEISIRTSRDESNCNFFNHSIFRINDSRELCRIRIEWKKKEL